MTCAAPESSGLLSRKRHNNRLCRPASGDGAICLTHATPRHARPIATMRSEMITLGGQLAYIPPMPAFFGWYDWIGEESPSTLGAILLTDAKTLSQCALSGAASDRLVARKPKEPAARSDGFVGVPWSWWG
jgi:hypothetical protein